MVMKQVDLAFSESGSDRTLAVEIIKAAREAERQTLGLESFGILKAYGIPVVQTAFAKTEEEAVKAAEEIGYPLVMKVVSLQISHKSDVGGIRLSLQNGDEVRAAYREMMGTIPEKKGRMQSLRVSSCSKCSQAEKK